MKPAATKRHLVTGTVLDAKCGASEMFYTYENSTYFVANELPLVLSERIRLTHYPT